MTVKELMEVIPDGVDLCLHFNGEDIIYNTPLAEIVGNCIIEKIELDTVNTPPRTIYANIKYIIARKEG